MTTENQDMQQPAGINYNDLKASVELMELAFAKGIIPPEKMFQVSLAYENFNVSVKWLEHVAEMQAEADAAAEKLNEEPADNTGDLEVQPVEDLPAEPEEPAPKKSTRKTKK